MTSIAKLGAVDLDRVEPRHARALQREYFDDASPLPDEERLLAARFCHALAESEYFELPEEAATAVLDRLSPDFPGESPSFHLQRWYHTTWLSTGARPAETWCLLLPEPALFPLVGIPLRRRPAHWDAQANVLGAQLASTAADEFWALNFEVLEPELDRRRDARDVYNRLLALLVAKQTAGQVPTEYAGVLKSFADLALRAPQNVVWKLGLVLDEVPERLHCGFRGGPELDVTKLFARGLGDEVDVPGLLRALRGQRVLRQALATPLRSGGMRILEDLRPEHQVEILRIDPLLLGAALASEAFDGALGVEGAEELIADAGAIPVETGGVVAQVRAHLWVNRGRDSTAVLALLATATVGDVELVAVEVLSRGTGVPLLDWIEAEPRLLGSMAWTGCSRLRQVAAVEPQAIRALIQRCPTILAELIDATSAAPDPMVPVARHVLGGWVEGVELAHSQFPSDDGRRLAAMALVDPANGFHTVRSTHNELKRYGTEDYAAGLRHVHYVSDLALGALARQDGDAKVRCDREVLLRLFVSSARFDDLPNTAVRLAGEIEPEAAHPALQWLDDHRAGMTRRATTPNFVATSPISDLELVLAVLAAASPAQAELVLARLLRVDGADVSASVRSRSVRDARTLCVAARSALGGTATVGFDALADSDAGRHATTFASRLETWAGDAGLVPLVLRGAAENQRRRFAASLIQAGAPVATADGAPWSGVRGREELIECAAHLLPGRPREELARVADRALDEVIPAVVRAALRDLAAGRQPWNRDGASPRRVLVEVAAGPWRDKPSLLARALLRTVEEAAAAEDASPEWLRACIFALGKLRDPLGGKVPAALHALARNEALPAPLRAIAREQEELWDAKNMKIQLKYSPEQRLKQAVQSLALGGSRADAAARARQLG